MFYCHNESFNIWSHFIGTIVFMVIAIEIYKTYPLLDEVAMTGPLVAHAKPKSNLENYLNNKI